MVKKSTIVDATYPAIGLLTITPSDDNELPRATRGIYVGSGGNISIQALATDDAVLLSNVQTGSLLPIQAIKVLSTNTTASNLVGLY